MFLWVRLVIDALSQTTSNEEFKQAVEDLLVGLNQV